MFGIGKQLFAAATVLGFAALFVGVGIRFSMADEPKAADLSDLRDAVKAADKRGENVDEVAKALDALEKALANGLKPEAGKTPAELTALRKAIEAAARKGENVEEITKQLEAVEMKLVGKVLTAPKPVTPPLGDPIRPNPNNNLRPRPFPNDFGVPPRIELPGVDVFPNFDLGNVDPAAVQRAMDLRTKALEQLLANPQDRDAMKKAIEANQEFLKALTAGRGGIVAPGLMMPNIGGADFGGGLSRVPDRFRLGVRMEKLSPIVVEQLGIDPGRGITITEVIAGSAAEKAGFKANDIVLEFAGKPVSDLPEDFNRQVTAVKAGEKVDAVVLRKGKKVEVKGIALPDVPQPAQPLPRLGMPDRLKPIAPNAIPDIGPRPEGIRDGNTMSFSLNNGEFTIKAIQNGVDYLITGKQEGANRVVSKITITDADKKIEAESLDKVPDTYKATVEKLVNNNRVVKSRVKD